MTAVQTPRADAPVEASAISKIVARVKRVVASNPSVLPTVAAIVIFIGMVIFGEVAYGRISRRILHWRILAATDETSKLNACLKKTGRNQRSSPEGRGRGGFSNVPQWRPFNVR